MSWFKRKDTIEGTNSAPVMVVGLGNPGRDYEKTRHNAGFMVVDHIAEKTGITLSKVKAKAVIGEGRYQGNKIILVKPHTYMNLSGQAVSSLARFYRVPQENILVIHDDLDLPLGTLRIRPNGGPGGQKGVASIIEKLGSPEFPRIRFGIGRPPGRMDAKAYVLERFLPREAEELEFTMMRARDAALTFVTDGLDKAMNKYNGNGQ